MTGELFTFNGVDGSSSHYLLPPVSPEPLSKLAQGETLDPVDLSELRWWAWRTKEAFLGPREGIDSKDLGMAGWGVIFAGDADPEVRQSLRPLLDHRLAQAGRIREHYYREFVEDKGYQPGESKLEFLARQGAGPGPADPEKVPYYLLIVGSPDSIPYSFQYQLDVQYAVGRIHFDRLDDYAAYADGVVAAETGQVQRPRRVTLFGTRHPGDRATALSAAELVIPLTEQLSQTRADWEIEGLIGEVATKARLGEVMGGDGQAPALLLSATHGVGFPSEHPQQLSRQGALLCQDWPGPEGPERPLDEAFYLCGDDLAAGARVAGMISFHFACFGAGTPRFDEYGHTASGISPQLAPHAFVAALPKRLLSHPHGGALAVISHVDRAWGYSFAWPQAERQTAVYADCFTRLMDGHPIGSAFEYFNQRYAELATDLTTAIEMVKGGRRPDHLALAGMWTAHNDARGFAILGDPAVRLIAAPATRASTQPGRETVTVKSGPITASLPPEYSEAPVSASSRVTVPRDAADVDFGLRDGMRQARERLVTAMQTLTERLGDMLERAVDSVTVLDVATYVTDDLAAVTYDNATKEFGGGARLRARSRIHIAGDARLLLPEDCGEIDPVLATLHLGMVEQAQAARAELLKTASSTAAGLLAVAKVW